MPLIVPPDKALGCNPRKSRFAQWCKPLAEAIDIIPQKEWEKYIGKITLDHLIRIILDQDKVGSCATESTTQGGMVLREFQGQAFELLNPWSIYRVTSHGRDNGSSIDENLEFARTIGILPESYWPRSKGWRAEPPRGWEKIAANFRLQEYFDIASTEEFGSALLRGFPVIFGYYGHSEIAVELVNLTTFKAVNSWGPNMPGEENGRHLVSLSSVDFRYGAFAPRGMVDSAY